MKVEFLNLSKGISSIKSEIKEKIDNVIDNTSFILGKEVEVFEKNFAEYSGFSHFIGCANGTDALEIAVQSLELSEGDEIIVQGNTYIATCLSVVNNKLNLVLCDIDKDTNMISIDDIENKITNKTKAIIVVHLYGLVPDMDKIESICEKNKLTLIEDCAQAHGAKWKGKPVGSFGKLACFSFYPGKNLGAFGDAGGIGTNDDFLKDKIQKIKNLGCKIKYHHEVIGRNSRMDTIQAVVLDTKLRFLESNNAKRRQNAQIYMDNLQDIDNICLPYVHSESLPVFHLFVIMTDYRDELQKYLGENGVTTLIHYPISISETDAFKPSNFTNVDNCITNSGRILSLPMYPELEESEILYVCKHINNFFLKKNLLKIKNIQTQQKSGVLHCVNNVQFDVKRFFYIDSFEDSDNKRGLHANTNCDEVLIIIDGSMRMKLTTKDGNTTEQVFERNQLCYVGRNVWLEFEPIDASTIIMVMANETLEKTISEYDFNKFLEE